MIARLAREPYERGDLDDDIPGEPLAKMELSSEVGAVEMPGLLTTASPYRRLIVVVATTGVFALLGSRFEGAEWQLAIAAMYAGALIICMATDLLAYRVPNAVTYPAIVASLAIGLALPDANRLNVVGGGLLFGGLLFVPALLTGGAMGMGDVKLAFFVGFALGLTFGVVALLVTAIAGGAIAIVLIVTRLRSRRDPIPYAPFIALGALYVLLVQGAAFVER